jgi:uncharacterized membrane protein YvbJ
MFCVKCGAKLQDGVRFCEACGAQVGPQPQPEPKPQSKPESQTQPQPQHTGGVMGVGAYVGSIIVMSLPLIGFIFMIIWACGGTANRNRVNLARAYLILLLIAVLLCTCVFLYLRTFFIAWRSGILDSLRIFDENGNIIPTLPTPVVDSQFPGILYGPVAPN